MLPSIVQQHGFTRGQLPFQLSTHTLVKDEMSEQMPERSSKVDFISHLPPEVVLHIAQSLEVDDALHCLRVSHMWFNVLSDLEPLWRRACHRFGLSKQTIEKALSRYESSKELLLAAKRHRSLLYATPPQAKAITIGCPYNVHRVCHYASGEDLVSVIYHDFRPCEILVEKLQHSSVQQVLLIKLGVYRTAENRVVWCHLFSDFLYCAMASGLWSIYCIRLSCLPLLEWKSDHLYDPDQRVGCCTTCHMVCTCKLVYHHNQEPHWDVRIISVDEEAALQCADFKRGAKYQKNDLQTIVKFKLLATNRGIAARQSNYAKKKVTLLSCTSERDSKGRCLSHRLLLQWANVISSHHLAISGKRILTSSLPESEYTIPCKANYLELAVVRNQGLNSEFKVSDDQQILGTLFQSHLIVWDVETSKEISMVEIKLEKYLYEEMKLIAVGHIYSLVGLEFSNVVLVVATSTGEVVLRCIDIARKHCTMVPPYISFLTAVRTDWLSDLTIPCSKDRPAITFWNKTSRSVEGVYFGKAPDPDSVEGPPTSKRKHSWWQWK